MDLALRIGARGLGTTAPNPAVGCVIVDPSTETVLARGWTQAGGRPHAETEALARAGAGAQGATAYVTLEPCSHQGKTPPCADALIKAGVGRVVVAIRDPDPRVAGRGLARLRGAGVAVADGVLEAEARLLARGYLLRTESGRPGVTVKLASSLDGRIAAQGGASQWITGPTARAHGHGLRASHDAIMVGAKTAILDNPHLTCRLPGLETRSPIRIVTDGQLRMPLTHHLVATAARTPTWVLAGPNAPADRRKALEAAGVTVLSIPHADRDGLDLQAALTLLGSRGLTRILVEGGATLVGSLMALELVDRLYWYRAPLVIGGLGVPAVGGLDVADPRTAPRFARLERRLLGEDLLEVFERPA